MAVFTKNNGQHYEMSKLW